MHILSIITIVLFPISFLVFINFLQHVVQFHFQQLQKLFFVFFIQVVLFCKLLGNLMEVVLVSSVKENSVGFVTKVYIEDKCRILLVFLLHVVFNVFCSAWVADALLIGHAGFSHWLVGYFLTSAEKLVFFFFFMTSFVHSVESLINMFGVGSGRADFIFFKVWGKGALYVINLATDPQRLLFALKAFVVIVEFKWLFLTQFAIEIGDSRVLEGLLDWR